MTTDLYKKNLKKLTEAKVHTIQALNMMLAGLVLWFQQKEKNQEK